MKLSIEREMRIRPSGKVFLLTFILIQLAALNTGENLFYLIGGALFSYLAVGYVVARWSLYRVEIIRDAPYSAYRLDDFTVLLHLQNRKRFFPAISLRIQSGETGAVLYANKLPPGVPVTLRFAESIPKRGLQTLPPVYLSTAFPFGLFMRRVILQDHQIVVVYPRVRPLHKNVLDKLDDSGQMPKITHAFGDEFYAMREYVPGDDLRHISWKVSARMGQLIIRELEPSTSRNVVLVLDTRGVPDTPQREAAFEDAMDLAASLAMSLLDQQYRVAVATPDTQLPLGKGHGHARELLEKLARVNPVPYEKCGDDWFKASGESFDAAKVYLTTDPAMWGQRPYGGHAAVLDPAESLYG